MRRRIAILLGQPEEYMQDVFMKAFTEEAFKKDYDVCVFGMYIKYQNTPEKSESDSAIFKLVNYNEFAAVVVMADTIQIKGVPERIEQELHKTYKGKVLFVDRDSKYFPSIHIDNYTPEKAVVSHLIEHHGLKDIAFLTGKSWHPHSQIRLQAYRDALTEHGIEVDENRIFYGDFWYTSGESLADSLVKSGNLPEAVACANDCMALGLAKNLIAHGYKIPEDIKVVGCDSNPEGRHAPVPLTSVNLSSRHMAIDSFLYLDAQINGTKYVKYSEDPELFIGGTCGCGCDSAVPTYYKRDSWDTELSLGTMFSPFNHLDDDLMAQTTYTGLINSIVTNIRLIRGFDGFSVCLNPGLGIFGPEFEDQMSETIRVGAESENNDRIMQDQMFFKEQMLPALYDVREKPAIFFFMPLFYEDSMFGFAAVRYDGKYHSVTPEYRAWLRSVARGIECYRRTDTLIGSNKIAKGGITTDSLTGLPNYRGFIEKSENYLNLVHNNGGYVGAIAVDVDDLSSINDNYGRGEGDKVICALAGTMEDVFNSRNCMCFRAGNDELVALRITRSPDDQEMLEMKDKLIGRLHESFSDAPYDVKIFYGIENGMPTTSEELERLVNIAISRKTANKSEERMLTAGGTLSEEEQNDARVVIAVLDENKINYHFQPIVDATTGKIYGYEALMRPDVTPYLAPPTVLRYAGFYGRLYDVERLTFHNVVKIMQNHESTLADGRKIFINAIPGYQLTEDDFRIVTDYVAEHPGRIVIEFTEQSEMNDDALELMKSLCTKLGIETAVDDYGTGYSNIANLLRYTPDYVKIDRALLSGIEDSPQKQHFVKDIIAFSHENAIKALAEGVETAKELKTVIELGVDLIQGYFTARPAEGMIQIVDSEVVKLINDYAKTAGR